MSNKPAKSRYLREQRLDIAALTSGFVGLLILLWLTGALGILEAFTAASLSAGLAMAYYISRTATMNARRPVKQASSTRDTQAASVEAKRAVLDALVQPALMILGGQIEACNGAAAKLFNLPADPIGLSGASLRNPILLSAVEQVLVEGGQVECELQSVRRPGEFWLAELTALGGDPRKHGVMVVMTDQRPVRLAERARADFLANASHELRTPLTSIAGFIETMQGPASDDLASWPRFINIMDEQTRHMRDLIADLLSLSRIELSEHLPPDTRFDLAIAADETIEALRHIAAQRGLTLNIVAQGVPLLVIADEGELKQVIRNLVSNAMKYAPENSEITIQLGLSASLVDAQNDAARSWAGAGRVTLLNPDQRPGNAAWLRVRDKGTGIAPEHLPRLGERFFRVDDSRGGPVEGTGLGLAIVKHIMARHQGGLAVESLVGKGAAFAVWFALAEEE